MEKNNGISKQFFNRWFTSLAYFAHRTFLLGKFSKSPVSLLSIDVWELCKRYILPLIIPLAINLSTCMISTLAFPE